MNETGFVEFAKGAHVFDVSMRIKKQSFPLRSQAIKIPVAKLDNGGHCKGITWNQEYFIIEKHFSFFIHRDWRYKVERIRFSARKSNFQYFGRGSTYILGIIYMSTLLFWIHEFQHQLESGIARRLAPQILEGNNKAN